LDIVGENPLIYAGMGYAYFHYVNLGVGQEEYIEKAKEYTRKALKLDPDCPQAHFTLGVLYMVLKDLKKGIYYLNKTLSANPNNIEALSWCGFFYYLVGKTDKANALWKRFTQLDPVNIVTPLGDGLKLFFEGKFKSAVPFFFKSYKTASDTPMLQFWYALSLAYNHRYEDVIPLVDQSLKSPNQDIWTLLSLFLKLTIQKDINGISNVLTDDFTTSCKRDLQYSYHIATFYSIMGQQEKAYEWLENAIDIGFINYPFINNIDPFLENLRGEERFKKLMERVKYEWENFEPV
jgi:tetratricopeptide (TPR) repeat protein